MLIFAEEIRLLQDWQKEIQQLYEKNDNRKKVYCGTCIQRFHWTSDWTVFFQMQGYSPNEYSYIWRQLLFSAFIGPFLVNYVAVVSNRIRRKQSKYVFSAKEKSIMFTMCLIFGFLAVYIGLKQKLTAIILATVYLLLLLL